MPVSERDLASRLRTLPRLVAAVLSLVWRSARREFGVSAAVNLMVAASTGIMLFAVRGVVAAALSQGSHHLSWMGLLPAVGLLIVVMGMQNLGQAVQAHMQRLVGELVANRATEELLDVSCKPGPPADSPGVG